MKTEDVLYDIIVAVAMLWAKDAGIEDYADLSNQELGSMASVFADIEKTTKRFAKGKITREQAEKEYTKTIIRAGLCLVKFTAKAIGEMREVVKTAFNKCQKIIIDAKESIIESIKKVGEKFSEWKERYAEWVNES